MVRWRCAGGEDRDTPSFQRGDRTETKLRFENRHLLQRADRPDVAAADEHHEIRDEHAVRIEVRKRIVAAAADENPRIDIHRRDRRTAAVEDDDIRFAVNCEGGTLQDVRRGHRTGQPTARAAAADRDDAGECRRLEIVRSGVVSAIR